MTKATAAAHRDFILSNLAPRPVGLVPEIVLYTAHERSGLGRLKADAPYFAYPWPGGIALARHLLDHPAVARHRLVLDLGTGSGLAAIAAARCGARVTAVDIDPLACAAARLNAGINGVAFDVLERDLLDGAPPAADLVLAGDVFYAPGLARRAAAFLLRCAEAGVEVLVGDPGRAGLPVHMLNPVSSMAVRDFGGGAAAGAAVFRVVPPERARPGAIPSGISPSAHGRPTPTPTPSHKGEGDGNAAAGNDDLAPGVHDFPPPCG